MKRFLAILCVALALHVPAVWADGPDDDYVAVYSMIQEADALNEKGLGSEALAKYTEAQNALKRFHATYPDLYLNVVNYRMKYLEGKIEKLSVKPAPAATPAPATGTNVAPQNTTKSSTTATPVAPAKPSPSAELENQVKTLQEQVKQLEDDRSLLQAKLKEALAARPAEADPQELAKTREQLTQLQKENDLLKATVATAKSKTDESSASKSDLEKTKQALAEANRKITALADANSALSIEKDALQAKMKKLGVADSASATLRDENAILKKQIAELKAKPAMPARDGGLKEKLQEAQAQLAALQSDKEIWRVEKMALENKVKQLATSGPAPIIVTNVAPSATASFPPGTLDSVTASRIAQLEAERDELQKNLDVALHDLKGRRKGREMAAHIDDMTRQLAALRARIQVFEATPIPYTPEEQALFAAPGTSLSASAHSSGRKPKQPPAAAQVLLAEGQRYFVAHEYDKADAKYSEALKLDPKNPIILSDLASIQLQEGRKDEAEKSISAAVAIAPEDAFNQMVLGQLKFEQKKYDDAFNALSQAAQMNPSNARIQNLLGLTLSEKGLRGPAETAFRKAIQIDPSFADAHLNLAVVYAAQQPPLLELARWHYQKALAAGHAPSPQLEKMLDPMTAAKR